MSAQSRYAWMNPPDDVATTNNASGPPTIPAPPTTPRSAPYEVPSNQNQDMFGAIHGLLFDTNMWSVNPMPSTDFQAPMLFHARGEFFSPGTHNVFATNNDSGPPYISAQFDALSYDLQPGRTEDTFWCPNCKVDREKKYFRKSLAIQTRNCHKFLPTGVPLWLSASVISAFNAIVFGLDTGTIGSVTTMPAFTATFGDFSATIHGLIVSSILLPGALTALVTGVLADRYGRTRIIATGSLIFGLGAALETAAVSLGMFVAGRLLKGVGEGLFLSTVYVHVCEISPARVRGVMASVVQFLITFGLVAGFFICYATSSRFSASGSSAAWRLPIALQAAIALANAAASCSLLPQSPRWLQARGRPDEARGVIDQLGLDDGEKAELLAQSAAALAHSPTVPFLQSLRATTLEFREAFAGPFRSRTLFGCFLLAMQQFSGIDGVLYYAPILLRQAGISSGDAVFLASGVSALVIMVTTIPATLLADAWGRKTSTLVGGSLIFTIMLIMGSLYAAGAVHADTGAARWVVVVCIYLYAGVFSATWSIGFRAFLIESLPRKTRSSASSLAQSSNWMANFLVALTTPIFIATSTFGIYFFFAGCTLLCTVVSALFMFETKGRTLESIEQRYSESQAMSTGRWKLPVHNFRLRRLQATSA
ncbi:Uu.00g029660.m01.CDS01 [Anthostomella pinea]|uniref:Uu.00g029660.m01.CDS01 n=1 Tax=Anthostomella pinea TaxID=933095 RepID=A0AAI8V876_9PEZI|nr:Uu.00g029660.m01.CDS01 [Anthostomella pinea]